MFSLVLSFVFFSDEVKRHLEVLLQVLSLEFLVVVQVILRGSLEAIRWSGVRRELGEYPDLYWDPDFGVIQELVERLRIIGVKPHCVGFAWKLSCGIATIRLGSIREKLEEAPTNLLMKFPNIRKR